MSAARASQIFAVAVAAGLLVSAMNSAPSAQAADPFIGKWTLNVAKSKYTPGPPPKSSTVMIIGAGTDRIRVVLDSVLSTGTAVRWEYTAGHDGKDYKVIGNQDADLISLKRINARSVETTNKKGGRVTLINTRTVSTDGKTMTVTTKGTTSSGLTVNNVQVYEKT
jgi:hypothetical protein